MTKQNRGAELANARFVREGCVERGGHCDAGLIPDEALWEARKKWLQGDPATRLEWLLKEYQLKNSKP